MNSLDSQTQSTPLLNKFAVILNKLAENDRNRNLDDAVNSWCIELSINKHFPQAAQRIIDYQNEWLQDNKISKIVLGLYRNLLVVTDRRFTGGIGNFKNALSNISRRDFHINIKETKDKMSTKSIVLIAFVFTGIGLLLFLLNQKEKTNNRTNQENNYSLGKSHVPEKYVLALLLNSERNKPLIDSLKNSSHLKPEDSHKLYKATQALWIGSQNEFNESKIKQEWTSHNYTYSESEYSEYDVYFVSIELNEINSGFKLDANQMDRRDAFNGLANSTNKITVSERLLSQAYRNTEFYNR
jgi:hypothetical protein